MTPNQWYIDRDGAQAGPVTWKQLQALARSGQLRSTDLVRREGMPFWQPAFEAREHGDASPPPPREGGAGPGERVAVAAASAITEAPLPPATPVEPPHAGSFGRGSVSADAATVVTPAPTVLATVDSKPSDESPLAAEEEANSITVESDGQHKTSEPAATNRAARRSYAGPALFALVVAALGLFGFGLLCGGSALVLACRALRGMRQSGHLAGRWVAFGAVMLAAAEVLVVAGDLASRARFAFHAGR